MDGRKPTDIEQLVVSIQSFNLAKMDKRMTEDYYDYEMDNTFALRAAVSEAIEENGVVIDGFKVLLP